MRRATNHRPPARRGGVTLTEVLMATMLMGIGVVTLATLFPISIMRSVRATQLTNATILRYNVESLINVDKDLVYSPGGGITPGSTDTHYMVDPMGWNRMGQLDSALQGAFGNNGDTTPYEVTGNPGLLRLNNGLNSLQKAVDGVTLPDSWVFQVESFPAAQPTDAGGGEGQVVLSDLTTADVSGISTASTAPSRIVFFTADNRFSETRTIKSSGIAGTTVTFLGSVPSINVARVMIETQEQRYTWMLTVRRNASAIATADVVIFFRRSFGIADETVHTAAFQQHRNKVQITFNTTSGEEPYLRKGGYVLDVNNARWYQIVNIENQTSSSATLVLDRNAVESSPATGGKAILMRGIVEVYPLAEIKQ